LVGGCAGVVLVLVPVLVIVRKNVKKKNHNALPLDRWDTVLTKSHPVSVCVCVCVCVCECVHECVCECVCVCVFVHVSVCKYTRQQQHSSPSTHEPTTHVAASSKCVSDNPTATIRQNPIWVEKEPFYIDSDSPGGPIHRPAFLTSLPAEGSEGLLTVPAPGQHAHKHAQKSGAGNTQSGVSPASTTSMRKKKQGGLAG
jgi:hypothetical protein